MKYYPAIPLNLLPFEPFERSKTIFCSINIRLSAEATANRFRTHKMCFESIDIFLSFHTIGRYEYHVYLTLSRGNKIHFHNKPMVADLTMHESLYFFLIKQVRLSFLTIDSKDIHPILTNFFPATGGRRHTQFRKIREVKLCET